LRQPVCLDRPRRTGTDRSLALVTSTRPARSRSALSSQPALPSAQAWTRDQLASCRSCERATEMAAGRMERRRAMAGSASGQLLDPTRTSADVLSACRGSCASPARSPSVPACVSAIPLDQPVTRRDRCEPRHERDRLSRADCRWDRACGGVRALAPTSPACSAAARSPWHRVCERASVCGHAAASSAADCAFGLGLDCLGQKPTARAHRTIARPH
jgi:hypothetical protein